MAKEIVTKKLSIEISKSIGKISAEVIVPGKPKAMITLAHGAGAGMNHPFMARISNELAALSIATLRFNFPFTENKKGRPDPPAVAEKTIEMVMNKVHELYPKLPVFGAGKSFGGRMTSQRLSKESPAFMRGIFFLGFPLHAPGAPSTDRAKHLADVKIPMLFLQGTRDALADMTLMTKVIKTLPTATLVTFEGADHSFKAGKQDLLPKLASIISEWIDQVLNHSR